MAQHFGFLRGEGSDRLPLLAHESVTKWLTGAAHPADPPLAPPPPPQRRQNSIDIPLLIVEPLENPKTGILCKPCPLSRGIEMPLH